MNDLPGYVLLALRLGLVVVLYSFLAWAFSTLWRELRQQGTQPISSSIPAIHLTLPEDSAIQQFNQAQVYVGRDPACEFRLENETVSSRHARLSFHHKQWWLEDLNSRNGTFLNEIPLDTPTVLTSNDQVRCGEVVFSITLKD